MQLKERLGRVDYQSAPMIWVLAGTIVLIALIVRLSLSDISLWADEAASVFFARLPLDMLWSDWMVAETNPPLYYTFLKIWAGLFGEGALAMRALSVLVGCLSVFMVFLIAREIGGVRAGLLAGLLMALSYQGIFYSLQVRSYIFTQAFALVAIYALLRVMRPDEPERLRRWALAVYVLGVVAAAYCHTTLIILPFLINLFLIPWLWKLWSANRRVAIEWVLAQMAVLILWLWWGGITLYQMNHATTIGWIPQRGLGEAVNLTRQVYAQNLQAVISFGKIWVVALVAITVFMAIKYRANRGLILPFIAFSVPVLIFLLNLKTPVMLNRTIFWGTGPLVAALAIGICAIPHRGLAAVAAGLTLLATATETVTQRHTLQMEPWRQMVKAISTSDPKAVVVASDETQAHLLQRYCTELNCALTIYAPITTPVISKYLHPAAKNQISLDDVDTLLPKYGTLYVTSRNTKNLNGLIAKDRQHSEAIAIEGGLPDNISITRWTAARPATH